ncbi:thymidine phosphorylase [Candidatus Microgenomates bacterium]|nr:thymidine phosphorylase [Candidatus Microgenomates bacterium]
MEELRSLAIEAIKKKLVGKRLNYREVFALMDEIANQKLGPILTTYFAAAGFQKGFSNEELYFLTRAMAETGERLHFRGIVADKHSIGGVVGTRVTMILVPIIAAAGFKIPKTSSRAITTPSGTADTMEVLAPVNFTPRQIEKIVNKIGGCIVWGGHLGIAPADDVIIQVEEPLAFESFDKIIISIMAKKLASGSNHIIFDVPVGPNMKTTHLKDAELIAQKFYYLARKFKMKIGVEIVETCEPAGQGIGPVLETLDVLKILEQRADRPQALEKKALKLAGSLLDLCLGSSKDKELGGEETALKILESGKALEKMREIVHEQGGDPNFYSEKLKMAENKFEVEATRHGKVTGVDNKQLSVIGRILGSPEDKKAGIFLARRIGEKIDKGDILFVIYSSDKWKIKEARETLKNLPIYKVE